MKSILLLIALFATGCASVIRLPDSTGQRPEVRSGFLKGHVGLDIITTTPVTIVNDVTTDPVTRDQIFVGADQNVIGQAVGLDLLAGSRMDFSLGLFRRLDFYLNNAAGVRYQVFGDPTGTGWKGTAFLGIFSNSQTSGVGEEPNLNSVRTQLSGKEFGFSVGHRLSESTLWYLTVASRGGDADLSVLRNSSETETYDDTFDSYIASLGGHLGSTWYFRFEITLNSVQWRGSTSTGAPIEDSGAETGTTLGFGYRWGAK